MAQGWLGYGWRLSIRGCVLPRPHEPAPSRQLSAVALTSLSCRKRWSLARGRQVVLTDEMGTDSSLSHIWGGDLSLGTLWFSQCNW
jgi:hypothetical protein